MYSDSYVLNLLQNFYWLLPVQCASFKTATGQFPLCVKSTCVQRSDFNYQTKLSDMQTTELEES